MRASRPWAVLFVLVAGACGGEDSPVTVSLAPSLLFPRGLLDGVTKVTVAVYDASAGVDCDATTGKLTRPATPFAQANLGATLGGAPCPSGGKFCGQLSVSKSSTPRLFQAQATAEASADVADGCTKAVVDQSSLSLSIAMVRYQTPAVCGNGKIEATEQCEPPDPTCDAKCHTIEQVLSSTTATGAVSAPFVLWPTQGGDAGRLLAFYGDTTPNGQPTSKGEIGMRVMGDTLAPLPGFASSTFLPSDPAQGAQPQPGLKRLPSAAVVSGQYFVAFEDDSGASGSPDIHLRTMDGAFTAQQPLGQPIVVNGPANGEPGVQTAPAIAAGPNGLVFIAWQDDAAQKIAGRTYRPGTPGTLGPQQDISSGTANSGVQLAATPNGWVAVWTGDGDVKLRSIDPNGNAFGGETTVNDNTLGLQDQPSIAATTDGRFAVVWTDHAGANGADILAQRFTSAAARVPGDQAAPINTTVAGDQLTPHVAATGAAGGAFVAAWLDVPSRHVRARILGAGAAFLANNVDGLTGDFQASVADGRPRAEPTVAIGGAGPFIAIGWTDQSLAGPLGITARRFPAPK